MGGKVDRERLYMILLYMIRGRFARGFWKKQTEFHAFQSLIFEKLVNIFPSSLFIPVFML